MEPLRYELIRSARKTLAISVDRDGQLLVRAPMWASQNQIDSFLSDKRRWIDQARVHMAELPARETLSASHGATFPYLGRPITLQYVNTSRATLRGDILFLPITASQQGTVPIVRWLETQARKELSARVTLLAQQYGFPLPHFRLTRAKGRWGSMSGRSNISLNRALILCPPEMIDYVILHELCHIPQPNHSPAFWAQVQRCLPDYKARRAWLKAHNSLIVYLPDGKA